MDTGLTSLLLRPGRRCVNVLALLSASLLSLLLGACAVPTPSLAPPAPPAATWQAPLPHEGQTSQLLQWWQGFDDPELPALIAQAQAQSPTLAQALARLRQARANLAAAGAGRLPSATLNGSATRASNASTSFSTLSQVSASVDALWELDLFGGVRHAVDAAQARADSAGYTWHEARLSLAADVADAYVGLRTCEALAQVYADDAGSQSRSAGLTQEKVRVGFESPANGALAEAAQAQARDRATAQQAQCDITVKTLVLLTALDESTLRQRLAAGRARLPQPSGFTPHTLPAQVLAQRPDLAAASRELVAAAYDVGVAQAQRYPSLSFNGSIGAGLVRLGGSSQDAVTWSFGPGLSLPLFDAGRRRAQADATQARYDDSRAGLEQRLRLAVREVEEALVRVDAAQRREGDAATAAHGFQRYFEAAEQRWRLGAGSLIEMEDARRNALSAQASQLGVQRERVAAWVSLYRAVGGGWQADTPTP
jgi:outer membrane protein, multidrug efflux system